MGRIITSAKLFTDGGSRGNPGPGAIGIAVVDEDGNILEEHGECVGDTTNNRAEYYALIKGLDLCSRYTRGGVTCFSDSELMIKQLNGEYKLKNDKLRALYFEVMKRAQFFTKVTFQHVKRTNPHIQVADAILNRALDGK